MSWTDQKPEATDVLLQCRVTCSKGGTAHIEIDKLPSGEFRLTEGNLFRSFDVYRNNNLEDVLRKLTHILAKS